MAKYTEEQVMNVIRILAADQNDAGKDDKDKASEKAEAEKAQLRAELEAELAAEKAEAEAEKAKVKAKAKPKEEDEDEEEDDKEKPGLSERERKFILKTAKADLVVKGVDPDLVDSLTEFISYDTLVNDAGEADDEKLKNLVDSIVSIATRVPPKGKNQKRDILDTGKEGLSRYLPKNNK